jgi:16S rRNA (cytidine1402-2'-O)-methyltransferase
MEIHGVALGDRPLLAYHDHNGDKVRPRLLEAMEAGQSVVYASEAGTALIADPGFDLARAAREAGHAVTTAPGVSAVVTALSLAALPTDRFLFAGFLPNQSGARRKALEEVADVAATLVFYESPKRLGKMLADARDVLGGDRPVTICRELTKKFEEIRPGTLTELAEEYASAPVKGELVVVIGRGEAKVADEATVRQALKAELDQGDSLRDASASVAKTFGWPKRKVYQLGLRE